MFDARSRKIHLTRIRTFNDFNDENNIEIRFQQSHSNHRYQLKKLKVNENCYSLIVSINLVRIRIFF